MSVLSEAIDTALGSLADKQPGWAEVFRPLFEYACSPDIRIDDADDGILHNPHRGHLRDTFATTGSDKAGEEEGLSRALFNTRPLLVSGKQVWPIACEAPLLRRREGLGRDGPKSRTVSCDVVALAGPVLTAVEVKSRSGGSTDLDYALIEGWAYGRLLAEHARQSPDHLHAAVVAAAKRIGAPDVGRPLEFAYTVAAPAYYFAEQLAPRQWRVPIDDLLRALTGCEFGGFWVLPGKGGNVHAFTRREMLSDNVYRGTLVDPNIHLAADLEALRRCVTATVTATVAG